MNHIDTLNGKLISSIDEKYPSNLTDGKMGLCIVSTPIVLVNGYRLPENHKVEDLRFITNFAINLG